MITDEEIPMMPMFQPDAKSLIFGLLTKDVSNFYIILIARKKIRCKWNFRN
jgi:hypothetical protein